MIKLILKKIIEDKSIRMNYILKKIFDNSKDYKLLERFYTYGKAGGTPSSINMDFYNGEIPFLSIADITKQGKYIYQTAKKITNSGLRNSSAWFVPKDSLILSMYASVGLPTINRIPLATSQALFSMILNDENDLDYLFYYLTYYQKYKLQSFLETGTQSNINADTIRKIPIPFMNNEDKNKISKGLNLFDNSISIDKIIIEKLLCQKTYLLNNLFV